MKNKVIAKIFVSLLLLSCICITSCSSKRDSLELPYSVSEGCPISPIRTGTERQNIYALVNGFECTKDGSYFMCRIGGGSWLLYIDHSSDKVIKLCGRPDCKHDNGDCNAYFSDGVNVCYYDNHLYAYNDKKLIRFNVDGTERVTVYDLDDFMATEKYTGVSSPTICNGIFSFGLSKLDQEGRRVEKSYYYKLDGSMKNPVSTTGISGICTDGESFVGRIGYDADTKEYIYGRWNPDDGSTTELFRDREWRYTGYFSENAEYYIKDGIIYENSYTEGLKIFLDTGLEGSFQLSMFPDCFAVSEYVSTEDMANGENLDGLTLRFYDWKLNSLGEAKINFELEEGMPGVICGETHERIYLTDSFELIPKYYIDKADFGTGEIRINKLEIPDFSIFELNG